MLCCLSMHPSKERVAGLQHLFHRSRLWMLSYLAWPLMMADNHFTCKGKLFLCAAHTQVWFTMLIHSSRIWLVGFYWALYLSRRQIKAILFIDSKVTLSQYIDSFRKYVKKKQQTNIFLIKVTYSSFKHWGYWWCLSTLTLYILLLYVTHPKQNWFGFVILCSMFTAKAQTE